MKAVILVGGKGTRLRPLSCSIPKPIVPVLNRPLLEHIIRNLEAQGIRDIVLALNYLPERIKETFGDGSHLGVRLVYVLEETPQGTSGAVKNAEQYLDEPFYVLNGDIMSHINLGEMMQRHRQARPKVTIALEPVDNPTIYGVVETEKDGRVLRFVEKPSWDKVTSNLINAGIYILEPEVLKHIPSDKPSMFESDIFPKLLATGEPVHSYPSNAYWIDIGTPEKYLKLNQDLLRQKGNEIFLEGESRVDRTAYLEPPALIGKGCVIEAGARIIGPAVLGSGCRVAAGATVDNSILWQGTTVGAGSVLRFSVAAFRCQIEKNCYLEECTLGDEVIIGQGTQEWGAKIPPGSTVYPRLANQQEPRQYQPA